MSFSVNHESEPCLLNLKSVKHIFVPLRSRIFTFNVHLNIRISSINQAIAKSILFSFRITHAKQLHHSLLKHNVNFPQYSHGRNTEVIEPEERVKARAGWGCDRETISRGNGAKEDAERWQYRDSDGMIGEMKYCGGTASPRHRGSTKNCMYQQAK